MKWYNKLLLSYLPAFVVISLVLTLTAILFIYKMSTDAVAKSSALLAQNAAKLIDNSMNQLEKDMFNLIFLDEKVKGFFRTNDDKQLYLAYQAVDSLSMLMEKHEMIHSVYLYRPADRMMLTPHRFAPVEQFDDHAFIIASEYPNTPADWSGARTWTDTGNAPISNEVVTLIKIADFGSKGLLVVNVSTALLQEQLKAIANTQFNYLDIVAGDGSPIASTHVKGQQPAEKMMSKARMPSTGWVIRSGIQQGGFAWFSSLLYSWFGIGIAFILIGIWWIVFITKRNYMPIQTILGQISSLQTGMNRVSTRNDQDEFSIIDSALEDLAHYSEVLQEKQKKSLALRKQFVFKKLIGGEYSLLLEENAEDLEQFDLLRASRRFIAIVEIDRYSTFRDKCSVQEQALVKLELAKAVFDIAESYDFEIWAEWIDDRQLAVLYRQKAEGVEEEIAGILNQTVKWAQHHLSFTLTIGVGNLVDQQKYLHESFSTASSMLNYKMVLGNNRVIAATDLSDHPKDYPILLQLGSSISRMFRLNDSQWSIAIDNLYEEIRKQMLSKNEVQAMLNYFVYHLLRELSGLSAEFQVQCKRSLTNLQEVLVQRETLDEIRAEVSSILSQIAQKLQWLHENKNHYHTISDVKHYIEENYANPDLSLAQISSEFSMGISSISQLFKDKYGTKFIDYVTQIRMEKALILLQNPLLTIQDISSSVGYIHSLTFIRLFKKHTGFTPGVYRKTLME